MIDQKKFFKYCKVVPVKEVSQRLGVGHTAVYNWIKNNRVPPIKWEAVNKFMNDLEKNNKELLARRIKEYDKLNKRPLGKSRITL